MPRVVGIDAGTVSLDVCGLVDGRLSLDRTWPTAGRARGSRRLHRGAHRAGRARPRRRARRDTDCRSGARADATDDELRLAFLPRPSERGGIGGLRRLARRLAASELPVVFTPGVIHLDTVPAHRKINRVDLGTADKVCAAALAIEDHARADRQARRRTSRSSCSSWAARSPPRWRWTGARSWTASAAPADRSAGGPRAPWMARWRSSRAPWTRRSSSAAAPRRSRESSRQARALAIAAYVEGAVKAVRQLTMLGAARRTRCCVSGRGAADAGLLERLHAALAGVAAVRRLEGFAPRREAGGAGRGAPGRWTRGGTARGAGGAPPDSGGPGHGARPSSRHHPGSRPPPAGPRLDG